MSYTFLQEQGEESSAECFSDIPASVLSRLNPTAEKSCYNDSETESCPSSQSGMMSGRSTEGLGGAGSMLCAGAFHAKESAWPETEVGWNIQRADCGENKQESLATFDPGSCSWRTHQRSLFAAGFELLEILPKWGMTAGGGLYPLATPYGLEELREWITLERECGYVEKVPTPDAGAFNIGSNPQKHLERLARLKEKHNNGNGAGMTLGAYVRMPTPDARMWKSGTGRKENGHCPQLEAVVGGMLNPPWTEWLMGWPIGWTDLKPLETARFQQWLDSHGKPLTEANNE